MIALLAVAASLGTVLSSVVCAVIIVCLAAAVVATIACGAVAFGLFCLLSVFA